MSSVLLFFLTRVLKCTESGYGHTTAFLDLKVLRVIQSTSNKLNCSSFSRMNNRNDLKESGSGERLQEILSLKIEYNE